MLKLNPDKKYVNRILTAIQNKNGYCCCQIFQDSDSFCPLIDMNGLPDSISIDNLCNNGKKNQSCICQVYVS